MSPKACGTSLADGKKRIENSRVARRRESAVERTRLANRDQRGRQRRRVWHGLCPCGKAVPRFPWCSMAYIVTEKTHMPVRVAWSRERYRTRRCERRRGHCASGRGRPQEEGNRDARAGGGRGAKGTKDGRVSAASRFPCRDGKLRVKIFSRLAPYEKSFLINILHATLGPNRRRGRELAGKLENPRIADWN